MVCESRIRGEAPLPRGKLGCGGGVFLWEILCLHASPDKAVARFLWEARLGPISEAPAAMAVAMPRYVIGARAPLPQLVLPSQSTPHTGSPSHGLGHLDDPAAAFSVVCSCHSHFFCLCAAVWLLY